MKKFLAAAFHVFEHEQRNGDGQTRPIVVVVDQVNSGKIMNELFVVIT